MNFWPLKPIGENILFIWENHWETDAEYDRSEIVYQIRDINGEIVRGTSLIHSPLSPDSVLSDEEYEVQSFLTDNNGRAWISYDRNNGTIREFYYVILDINGTLWKGPVQTSNLRHFSFIDKEGFIWASENGQVIVLNDDDTVVVPARPNTWVPNQNVKEMAATVDTDGYRLYDRWSPQILNIDIPAGVAPSEMELYDLNLWNNNLHPANISIVLGNAEIWSQRGQFTGNISVDVSGVLSEGVNSLTMTQDDFHGGQVLVTFPYEYKVDLPIQSGWSLISLPRQPNDTSISTCLNNIAGKYLSVWAYENGSWKVYDPNNPGFSDLLTFEAGKGYWINMTESANLTLTGIIPSNSISLSAGWNLVGYNSSISQPIGDALASIAGKYISVWAYIDGGWKVYDPNNPGFSDLITMDPGYGYWINMTEAATWMLP
jgi:hypothetical protein